MQITSDVIDDFREAFPEFSDQTKWSAGQILVALQDADNETGSRWGGYANPVRSLKQRGMFAYAAHALAKRAMQAQQMAAGSIPTPGAQISGKSVGDESTSYAVSTPSYDQATSDGDLYLTAYGKEFLRLRSRIVGPAMV
ncbi:DUF4054 domain-containing protein [Pseudomonas sp. dw_358]|uniref:DUF4054 domain-containing protein n=1 Tax=Pseudomonas sp. dw_358 TaxID=2720083 RepID=UPI001BD1D4CB|nr:DUF4054 domain-containing protein [Pseudomonas sp. dw_358]